MRIDKLGLFALVASVTNLAILYYVTSSWYERNHYVFYGRANDTMAALNPNRKYSVVIYPWKITRSGTVFPVSNEPNPHDYNYMFEPRVCGNLDRNVTSVLILIVSHADNTDRRRIIRNSWAERRTQMSLNFRVIFLLGQSRATVFSEMENAKYGDVLQEDFAEKWENLGLKSVMGLKWASKYCRQAEYVTKVDDDIFVHVSNLFKLLSTVADWGRSSFIVCQPNPYLNIVRNGPPKYTVRWEDLPGTRYPQYCSGFIYVMSLSAVDKLFDVSLRTPYFFLEDVYVTGFCRRRAGVVLLKHDALNLYPTLGRDNAICEFTRGRITSHEVVDHAEMNALWRVSQHEAECEGERYFI